MRLALPLPTVARFSLAGVLVPVLIYLGAVLLLAGIIHIVAILLVPRFAETDGWSRLESVAGQARFVTLPPIAPGGQSIPGLDPLFLHAACRLDLAEVPAVLALSARERFWSMAIYDPAGTVIFSLNDRTAVEGDLDMLVATPVQHAELRDDPAFVAEETIVVESTSAALIALLRLYAPTAASRREAETVVAGARCGAPAPAAGEAAPESGGTGPR